MSVVDAYYSDNGNALLRAVLRENRLTLVDNIGECLAVADWIFEQGFLRREDYNEIEKLSSKAERAKKLVDILETKENGAFQALISYLEKEKAEDTEKTKTNISPLIHRLKNSHAKFSVQFPEENLSVKLMGLPTQFRRKKTISPTTSVNDKENIKDAKRPIDPNDFTVTEKEIKTVYRIILVFHPHFVMRKWPNLIESMNGVSLEDIDLVCSMLKSDPLKWEDVIAYTLTLWMNKNGKNATFFSLVGLFQEARLYDISDSLLDNKDDIQNSK